MNWKRGYRKDKGRDNTGRWLKRHRETRTCRGSLPLGPSEDYFDLTENVVVLTAPEPRDIGV